jgi:1-acyl-sn-glycerol-3-phosphate acyltransferase
LERPDVIYAVLKVLVTQLSLLVYRPHVEGRENIPTSGPVILASNHLSFIDSILIPVVAPRQVAFIAKAEYFESPGLTGWLMKSFFHAIGSVPVRRGDHRAAQEALDTSLAVIESGTAFGIYPEGTRSLDGRLYRPRVGVGWLALKSGAPIIPVGLIDTQKLLPLGARIPRLHRVTVRFGAPIDASRVAFPGEPVATNARARRAVADAVVTEIQKLSGQDYAGVYNERPSEE